MITCKCAPALAAGLHGRGQARELHAVPRFALAEFRRAPGIPKGVFNVVIGSAKEVGALTGNDKVRKLSFTGPTEVGKILLKQCADTVKKAALEPRRAAP